MGMGNGRKIAGQEVIDAEDNIEINLKENKNGR